MTTPARNVRPQSRNRLRLIPGGGASEDVPQSRLRVIEGGGTAAPLLRIGDGAGAVRGRIGEGAATARARIGEGAARGRSLLSAAIASAGAWLVEPAEDAHHGAETAARSPTVPRTVIAVFGLAPACGATVVARALAVELAARDPTGTAAVECDARASGIPLATRAASRLALALEDLPRATTKAVGRLCLVEGPDRLTLAESSRHLAPLVLDAGSASIGGTAAAVADRAVLVATPGVEPALARVAAGCLARVLTESIIVLNRVRPDGDRRAGGEAGAASGADTPGTAESVRLPETRMGAQLALGGREPRGDFGRAIAVLANRCEGPA
jgi:hypothetical protein